MACLELSPRLGAEELAGVCTAPTLTPRGYSAADMLNPDGLGQALIFLLCRQLSVRGVIHKRNPMKSICSILGAALGCFAAIATAGTNSWTRIGTFPAPAFITADPTSISTLYIGVRDSFRILKTTDGGATWSSVLSGNEEFLDLAVHSQAPTTLYAVARGKVNFGGALYKSTDGGATWTVRNIGLTAEIKSLTMDPQNPSTVYAVGHSPFNEGPGVFKTVDGALTWNSVFDVAVARLAIDPAAPSTLYARGYQANAVFKTVNAGATWTSLAVPSGGASASDATIGLDPVSPATIYGAGALPGIQSPGTVFKTADGGGTWAYIDARMLNFSENPLGNGIEGFAFVPGNPSTIFVRAAGNDRCPYRSLDGGVSWTDAGAGLPRAGEYGGFGRDPNSCWASLTDISASPASPNDLFATSHFGNGAFRYTHDASVLTPSCTLSAAPTTVAEGGSSTLFAYCSPTATSYVWSSNSGFSSSMSQGAVRPTRTTTYTVQGVNANGTSNVASVTVLAPSPRLVNISTRGQVLDGNESLIGGFIIQGNTPKTIVVRARGPSLAAMGVPGTLADPVLTLFKEQAILTSNSDWGTAHNAAALQASGFAPSNAKESAILVTLNPGAYTAVVSGAYSSAGYTTGVAIVEVFEVDHPENPLVNIATRGPVLTGDQVLIAGFIIQGNGPQTVVVRARGPSLAPFGVTGTLADPVLRLYTGDTLIATNDNWVNAANAAQLQASGFAPSNSNESAILITLNPGAYTAIVSGAADTTGVGIVEVFSVP